LRPGNGTAINERRVTVTSATPARSRVPFLSFTTWSLLAFGGGLALGIVGHASSAAPFASLGTFASAVGDLWISALQLIALPLALAVTLAAMANATAESAGSLGVRAVLLFLLALIIAAFFAAFATRAGLAAVNLPSGAVATLSPGPLSAAATTPRPAAEPWWVGLIPKNIFAAAARGDIFPLLLAAIVFGIAVAKLPNEQRLPMTGVFIATSQALLTVVRWLLRVTPLGVFALSFVIALHTGTSWAGALGVYLLLRIGITILCLGLLYPITALLGRSSVRAFAKAVLPAQVVAASTRSSLAALPALVAGGSAHMGLTATATDFILPLGVALFRIGTVLSNPIKLVFLAHVYGIALRPETVVVFIVTEVVFTLSAAGIPNGGGAGGGYRMIPVFAAAGIPVEGVVMLDAVETIPDIFETVANVTGQMSVASILTRGHARLSAVPEPQVASVEIAS
jgi:proton glutamate symport protein